MFLFLIPGTAVIVGLVFNDARNLKPCLLQDTQRNETDLPPITKMKGPLSRVRLDMMTILL